MSTALLILALAFIGICAAELVRVQCRRMLQNPHPSARRRNAAVAAVVGTTAFNSVSATFPAAPQALSAPSAAAA